VHEGAVLVEALAYGVVGRAVRGRDGVVAQAAGRRVHAGACASNIV